MAVYDAFMFFNEFELLAVRLEEHDPFVDFFILAQADRNHAGKKKELLFNLDDPRFQKYAHKIIVVNVALEENPKSAWDNESAQRQAALDSVKFNPDDIIYLADVDEIISRDKWPYLIKRMKSELLLGVWLRMFYYSINLELIDHPWTMPKLIKAKLLLETEAKGNSLRCSPAALSTPFPCGWHFSYLLSVEGIIEKISSLAHQENNTKEFKDPKRILKAIREKRDLFGRNINFRAVDVDSSWPLGMLGAESWQKFIIPNKSRFDLARLMQNNFAALKSKAKPFLKPLLKKIGIYRGTPDSYNQFGSDLYDRLIDSSPQGADVKEWRRLIEFLGFVLVELEGELSARQCAELFIRIVKSMKPGAKIVEVGSSKGRSSVFASRAAACVEGTLFCVDTAQEDVFKQYKNNIFRFGSDNVVIARGKSVEVAANWPYGQIDFLFVDASHDYDSVLKDLKAWVPLLRPGGVVCGDDWNREEMSELKGSARSAFQDFFKTAFPNLGIVERFWAHQIN